MSKWKTLETIKEALGECIFHKNNEYSFHCPKCHHRKYKLQVNLDKNVFHCWVCGYRGGSIVKLLKDVGRRDLIPRIQHGSVSGNITEADFYTELYSDSSILPKLSHSVSLPSAAQFIYSSDSILFQNARRYLLDVRGLREVDIYRYFIHYDDVANEIIIPSYDSSFNMNFYISRKVSLGKFNGNVPVYGVPSGVPKKDIIIFESNINWNYPVVIVEGIFDAIAVRTNCIPVLGNTLSKNLIHKLVEKEAQVYIVFDSDALIMSLRAAKELVGLGVETYITKLDGDLDNKTDPDSLGYKRVWSCIENSIKIDSDIVFEMQFEEYLKK